MSGRGDGSGLDRRELLTLLLGAAAAPAGLLSGCAPGPDPHLLAESLRRRLHRAEAAGRVGKRLVGENPRQGDLEALAARVAETLQWTPELEGAEFDRRLVEAIRADFAAGRTLGVGGWVLSATEVRVAVLVALG